MEPSDQGDQGASEVRLFLRILGKSWVALVSGILGICSASAGIWGPASAGANRLFLSAGVLGIVFSAFLVWREEHRAAEMYRSLWRMAKKERDEALAKLRKLGSPRDHADEATDRIPEVKP